MDLAGAGVVMREPRRVVVYQLKGHALTCVDAGPMAHTRKSRIADCAQGLNLDFTIRPFVAVEDLGPLCRPPEQEGEPSGAG